MYTYFLRKKHGSISVMLAVLLIATLSLNTSLLEIAKYKSMERMYRQLTENSLFSVLGHYDRDLYKQYGLLAMEKDAGKDTFLKYFNNNLEVLGVNQNQSKALKDAVASVEFDKLYDLTQKDVMISQIMEFTAYRAPVSLINNTLNIEEFMDSLLKELQNALPMLKLFQNLSKAANKIVTAYSALSKLGEKAKALSHAIDGNGEVIPRKRGYTEIVGLYNATVADRNAYRDNPPQIETEDTEETEDSSNTVSMEEYNRILGEKNALVAEHAVLVQESIVEVSEALWDYQEAYIGFFEAFDSMNTANLQAMLTAAKVDANGIEDQKTKTESLKLIKTMEESVDLENEDNVFKRMTNALNAYSEAELTNHINRLNTQSGALSMEAEMLDVIEAVKVKPAGGWLDGALRIGISILNTLWTIIESLKEMIESLLDYVQLIEVALTGGTYHLDYITQVRDDIWNELPGRANGHRLYTVQNPYAQGDMAIVSSQLQKTEQAAAATEFDLGTLDPIDRTQEMNLLRDAINRVCEAEEDFRGLLTGDRLDRMKGYSILSIVSFFVDLATIIVIVIKLIDSIINLINVLIETGADSAILLQYLYQNIYIASYANDMFSNRTTSEDDEKMNGESFQRYPGSEAFTMANTEYIVSGNQSEQLNQINVFFMMLMIRLLCNIPALVSDKIMSSVLSSLSTTGIGIVVAIIIALAMLFIEAWLDMIFMTYGDGSVSIIKMNGYCAWDGSGVDQIKEEIKGILGNEKIINKTTDVVEAGQDALIDASVGKSEDRKKLVEDVKKNLAKKRAERDGKAENGNEKEKTPGERIEGVLDNAKEGLLEWTYKDHLFLLILLTVPTEKICARSADLIEMQMRNRYPEFRLKDAFTYARAKTKATYKPMLPIPSIPGIAQNGISMESLYYSGY